MEDFLVFFFLPFGRTFFAGVDSFSFRSFLPLFFFLESLHQMSHLRSEENRAVTLFRASLPVCDPVLTDRKELPCALFSSPVSLGAFFPRLSFYPHPLPRN